MNQGVVNKCRPGDEDYARNQFIYGRQIYSGMILAWSIPSKTGFLVALDYFKLFLTNIASTEDEKYTFCVTLRKD